MTMNTSTPDPIVLSVRDLNVSFDTMDGTTHAVRGVGFDLPRGKTVALVGESGSGKSVTSYAILRLIQKPGRISGGQIIFNPHEGETLDLAALRAKDPRLFKVRGGKISMIFQEPMTALSPVHTIGNQIREAILLHRSVTKHEADQIAVDMLGHVGIPDPEQRLRQYPFEFSGGMRQRVVIAMALVCRPEVLIADEPTTALDVTIQAQILELINDLREQMGTSVLFITHDLGVVAQVADDVVVMQHGRVVEKASVRQLYRQPYHPYTKRLLAAMPSIDPEPDRIDKIMRGGPPSSDRLPDGFGFRSPGVSGTSSALGASSEVAPQMHRFADGREVLVWPQPIAEVTS